jgi:hypothetical protein
VIDRDDITVYREYLPAIGEEPDYGKVLEAAKNALV